MFMVEFGMWLVEFVPWVVGAFVGIVSIEACFNGGQNAKR